MAHRAPSQHALPSRGDLFAAGERARAGPMLTIPNALTIARVLLIPPFLTYYLANHVKIAAILFAVAAATDILDGLLARLLKQHSALGAVLDPFADKMLSLAALVAVVMHGRLPLWLLFLSLARDAVVVVIAIVARARDIPVPIHPSRVGKYATFTANAAVILALVSEITYAPWLAGYVAAMTLVAGECLLVAAVQYAWRFTVLCRTL